MTIILRVFKKPFIKRNGYYVCFVLLNAFFISNGLMFFARYRLGVSYDIYFEEISIFNAKSFFGVKLPPRAYEVALCNRVAEKGGVHWLLYHTAAGIFLPRSQISIHSS